VAADISTVNALTQSEFPLAVRGFGAALSYKPMIPPSRLASPVSISASGDRHAAEEFVTAVQGSGNDSVSSTL